MVSKRDRKLKRENWLERNGKWYYPFVGFLLADGIITIVERLI